MDFLKSEMELREAESEGISYGNSKIFDFLKEEKDDGDLAYDFPRVSSLSWEES